MPDYGTNFDPSNLLRGLNFGIFSIIVLSILGVSLLVLSYYLFCVIQEKTASKAGVDHVWMAYLPVARNIQRMKIVDMGMWKLMFVGNVATPILAFFVIWGFSGLVGAIAPNATLYLRGILNFVYTGFWLWCTYEYLSKLTKKFGYNPILGLLMMFSPVVYTAITVIIAFSNRVQAEGSTHKEPETEGEEETEPGMIGLEGVYGQYMGAKIEMKPTDVFVVGRDSTLSNIIVNYEKVSKRHCSIKYNSYENCYSVVDFSTNGTFAGNNKLTTNVPTNLARGTIIAIGDKENQFRLL